MMLSTISDVEQTVTFLLRFGNKLEHLQSCYILSERRAYVHRVQFVHFVHKSPDTGKPGHINSKNALMFHITSIFHSRALEPFSEKL